MCKRCVCVLAFLILLVAGGAARADQAADDALYIKEVYHTALNVYYEARGEPELGQQMVAYLTVMRAQDNRRKWGGGSILGVIYKKAQFSWTFDSKRKLPKGPEWEHVLGIVIDVLHKKFVPPPELANARSYMNPRTASPRERCRMAANLRQVGIVGNHYFYSEEPAWLVPPSFKCGKVVGIVPMS